MDLLTINISLRLCIMCYLLVWPALSSYLYSCNAPFILCSFHML